MKINTISLIISMITGIITTIIAVYSIDKPASHLTAYVTDSFFTPPPQHNKIMRLTFEKADYNKIYDRIDSLSKTSNFEEKSKFVKEIINSILTPFNPPFQNGLWEYKKLIFIKVHNSGDASAKDIYIDYPEKVLVMVIDDKKEQIEKPNALTRLSIPSIRQGGNYSVWAWAKNNDFKNSAIRIGNDNQIAKIEYGERHFGTSSYIASFYENHERIIKAIFTVLVFLGTLTVCSLIFNLGKKMLKTE
ncbi:hypothetical protein [Klebsiella spallanzanii]|uniref:hypothetical protein n=1 Tax=Klebsiella spallanzanii TaxID=2587528 RepID=UPI00115B571E|nr:hypothetical protein [Klebsiella spallanzanii]VUT05936.1 hypothetical protein SB6419_05374 [Klebsiella spallanzanii]